MGSVTLFATLIGGDQEAIGLPVALVVVVVLLLAFRQGVRWLGAGDDE